MTGSDARFAVLFVCLGNICRSPLAEGAFRERLRKAGLVDSVVHDSAGTGAWHVGEPPDRRAIATARARGVDISDLRARQVRRADFSEFDLILAMDRTNLSDLRTLAPRGGASRARVELFRSFDPELSGGTANSSDVPDPYTGEREDFELVFDMVDRTAKALIADIAGRRGGASDAASP